MELTNAQIALQAAVAATVITNYTSDSTITSKAGVFLRWLNNNTPKDPEERVQDER